MKVITRFSLLLALIVGVASLQIAQAETRITYRSAKSTSSYYQMGVQIAEAMKAGSNGAIVVTVEEGQGSVSNVVQVPSRGGDYVFTTPPVLVKLAKAGKAMFKDKGNPAYAEIRALFPIPSLTMHFVVSEKSGIESFADMKGKTILLGKGSFGAKEGAKYIDELGLQGAVNFAEVELSNAVPALKNGQIDGFVTAGSYPAPNVVEAAASMPVRLISLGDAERSQSKSVGKRKQLIIPAGTYEGQDADVSTTTLEVVAYATTKMSDETAYQLTRTYWEMKAKMGESNPWWNGVDKTYLKAIIGPIHPGAEKYYREAGFL
ncbi:MAG: TAXI family TRAP transporter solute-binding subunit [Gammaproteobacteria bacterium]|nr:TAXI family TRAP transporter solute-binding subunit [Gammaproteobacteria bacterium]